MSLRSRVLLGFLAITLLLVATDVVIAVTVHRSLIDQVDRRIAGALEHTPAVALPGLRRLPARSTAAAHTPGQTPPSGSTGTSNSDLTEFSIGLHDHRRQILRNAPAYRDEKASPAPRRARSSRTYATDPHAAARYFTVGADGASGVSYRMAALRVPNGYLIVGVSLQRDQRHVQPARRGGRRLDRSRCSSRSRSSRSG